LERRWLEFSGFFTMAGWLRHRDLLGRYEGRLERALARTMGLFRQAQAARRRNKRESDPAS
jgi:hypothetical protein